MAEYNDIADYIKKKYGKRVESCCIAQAKRKNGLPMRNNRTEPYKRKCSEETINQIEEAMRALNIL